MHSEIQHLKNVKAEGADSKEFLLDIHYKKNNSKKDLVIFCHGFKGFKDWGAWRLIALEFAKQNLVFVSFNFSHNGTSTQRPEHFDELSSFAENNYSKELSDLKAVINYVKSGKSLPKEEFNPKRIHLIGHSRGGGLVLSTAFLFPEVRSVSSWAAVSSLDYAWKKPGFINDWKQNGFYEVLNGRTKQMMQINFQMYQDFKDNMALFNTEQNLKKFKGEVLLIHGDNDPAVPLQAIEELSNYRKDALKIILQGCDHVFNMRHPYPKENALNPMAQNLCKHSIDFIKNVKQ